VLQQCPGRDGREIADKLVLSPGTVDRHLATAYRKLGVTNRAQATSYALRHGLAGPGAGGGAGAGANAT
jgi:DNA-binding NarL/FixJ family response regulator